MRAMRCIGDCDDISQYSVYNDLIYVFLKKIDKYQSFGVYNTDKRNCWVNCKKLRPQFCSDWLYVNKFRINAPIKTTTLHRHPKPRYDASEPWHIITYHVQFWYHDLIITWANGIPRLHHCCFFSRWYTERSTLRSAQLLSQEMPAEVSYRCTIEWKRLQSSFHTGPTGQDAFKPGHGNSN